MGCTMQFALAQSARRARCEGQARVARAALGPATRAHASVAGIRRSPLVPAPPLALQHASERVNCSNLDAVCVSLVDRSRLLLEYAPNETWLGVEVPMTGWIGTSRGKFVTGIQGLAPAAWPGIAGKTSFKPQSFTRKLSCLHKICALNSCKILKNLGIPSPSQPARQPGGRAHSISRPPLFQADGW